MTSNYTELLKDPRWQKKRLEILQRDGWACIECKCSTETLHVHHKKYTYGKIPWEAEDSDLITLCEGCHALEESLKRDNQDISEYATASGLTNITLWKIAAAMTYCSMNHPDVYAELTKGMSELTFGLPKGSHERQKFYNHLINPRRKG